MRNQLVGLPKMNDLDHCLDGWMDGW